MKIILALAFAASVWGADINVRISSDSPQAAEAVWRSLNKQGQALNLRFVRAAEATTPDYTLVVTWQRFAPMALIQVYGRDNTPLYSVWKRGAFTRGSAVSRCVAVLVRDLSHRAP